MTWAVPVIEFCVGLCWLVLLEQWLASGVIRWWHRRHPALGGERFRVLYQRSLFTPVGGGVGGIWLALVAGAGILTHAVHDRTWAWLACAACVLVALAADLRTRSVVMLGVRELRWHRGLGVRERRVSLRDVASVRLIERPAVSWPVLAGARWLGPLGVCQLVLTLHDGRLVRLPRTGWLTSGLAVRAAARRIQRGRRVQERRHLVRLRARMTALARTRQAASAEMAALRRELHHLEGCRRQDRHAAARRLHALVQSARRDDRADGDSRLWAPTLVTGRPARPA